MNVVKDQLHIHLFGLGIKETYHQWSKEGYTYTLDELFEHLVVAIPKYLVLKAR